MCVCVCVRVCVLIMFAYREGAGMGRSVCMALQYVNSSILCTGVNAHVCMVVTVSVWMSLHCVCVQVCTCLISLWDSVCVCVCVCVLGGTEGLHESVPCVCARGGWDGRRQPTRHAGRGKPSRWRGLNDSFLPSSPLRLVQPPSSDLGPGYFANPTALEGSQPSLFLRDESRWQEQEGCPPPSTNSKMPTCFYKPYANEPCSQPLSTTCLMGIIDGASSGA